MAFIRLLDLHNKKIERDYLMVAGGAYEVVVGDVPKIKAKGGTKCQKQ